MINDIIKAHSANLLTQAEAKSYIQRMAEAIIQQSEAHAEEISANAASILDQLEECDCPCGTCGIEDPNVPLPKTADQIKAEMEAIDNEFKNLGNGFKALLEEILGKNNI